VGKKRELIEKLKEKRTALISRTVTRGLNPNVKLKSSGIEWLGDIPKHWEVKRLRFLARIQTGNTPAKSDDENYAAGGLMWIKPDDLAEFEPVTETKEFLSDAGRQLSRPVPAYSPLVCCIGTVGKFGFSEVEVATNQQINTIVFDTGKMLPDFGLYVIASTTHEHLRRANTNVVSILNSTHQSNIVMPVPPFPEQRAITDYLDRETAKLGHMMEKVEAAIEKLQEYRTALITAAVTGKIDVRNSARAVDSSHHTH
jgi:type I restriction enzyme, S subunit